MSYLFFLFINFCATIKHCCVTHLYGIPLFNFFCFKPTYKIQSFKYLLFFFAFTSIGLKSFSQKNSREDILLNNDWAYTTEIKGVELLPTNTQDFYWTKVTIPHNLDAYDGYRRLLHGNKHGDMWYKKIIKIVQTNKSRRNFLFFEGVGSYAKIYLNRKFVGVHAGGRTTFTIDVTSKLKTNGSSNELLVYVNHPANINDLPWVCGGCSQERGFSEGSQPMGIFRPVHLIVTNDVRIVPFGVHAWADIKNDKAFLFFNTTLKNYSQQNKNVTIVHKLVDASGKISKEVSIQQSLKENDSITVLKKNILVENPILWSIENPYLYKIISTIKENNIVIDKTETDFGFRTINFKTASHQFLLNEKPVFINGIAEYEHLLGQSHAFSNEQIVARMKWIQAAGFNALRDAHQPHNLLYGKLCNEKGMLWWTQFSAHVWYDTKAFRENFKTLLKEWVIERRNDPSLILWGLQNESKLPKDFAEECTALIRSLDPTASSQRLITTCNGGEGSDWDVPQNWTGTYGGNPKTYSTDLKKQILVGEYGAWRTLDLHTDRVTIQNGIYSEDKMTALMETKVKLAEAVKDSAAGHFAWLLTSHDNPGRVQGGEGLRELDRIGPVNYKGLLTPWEEPTDAFYMYRSNYANKQKEPMVYIVSHTWPNRWMTAGIKNNIIVYSNCDEVELFNDVENISLGKQKRNGIGTHFTWNNVNVQYNVLYAVAYVNGKAVARDLIVLNHLPQTPNFNKLYTAAKNITKPQEGYKYLYRVNCGGGNYVDEDENFWQADYYSTSWTDDFESMPKSFASQRRTFSPIKNTKDWKLFQNFRYGKDKLKYEFELEDGEYLVELYFIEPWLGIGGGMNAKGMRIFDVAINGKPILNDLDIWKEVGENKVLKKIVATKVVNGKLIISFPESKVGQAVISAIAIASLKSTASVSKTAPLFASVSYKNCKQNSWLDIGDKQFADDNIQINGLPSYLFGADWFQFFKKLPLEFLQFNINEESDLFIGFEQFRIVPDWLKEYEKTNSEIITDEGGGKKYQIYKKRILKNERIDLQIDNNCLVIIKKANYMQPAYDLKPVTPYRPNSVKLSDSSLTKSIINEKETITFAKKETAIEWNINIGAADIYSLTIRYANETNKNLYGRIEIAMTDGTVIKNEKITFTTSKVGKWNYVTTNTGSMINAGNYVVKIIAEDAIGVGVSALDIQ
jgi:beta-galactosidase